MRWVEVGDNDIAHIWLDDEGEEHRLPPWFYADVGTPINESGDDMEYLRTEAKCGVSAFTEIFAAVIFLSLLFYFLLRVFG